MTEKNKKQTFMQKSKEFDKASWLAYSSFWKKYFDYKTKSTRMEYNLPLIIHYMLSITFLFFGLAALKNQTLGIIVFSVIGTFYLVTQVGAISLMVRRMRDLNKNPKRLLFIFIPYFGIFYIVYIGFCCIFYSSKKPDTKDATIAEQQQKIDELNKRIEELNKL